MVTSRTYLWYILGIYWVYHGHIFGILGYIMKIGFQYKSYHLVHLMSITIIFTIMSLPNTTISSANSLKLSNVCKGVGINWATNLKNDCFLPQRTLSKIWVSCDHWLSFTVIGPCFGGSLEERLPCFLYIFTYRLFTKWWAGIRSILLSCATV